MSTTPDRTSYLDGCRTCIPPAKPTHGWHRRAACAHAEAHLFIPLDGESGIPTRARYAAARYCAICPVLSHCEAEATANRNIGLWAGTWRDNDHSRHQYRIRNLI